jgi:hypothetical protein
MTKQYYYSVFYDTKTKEWAIDFDISLNYDSGDVWNTETQEWEIIKDESEDNVIIGELSKKLAQQVSA